MLRPALFTSPHHQGRGGLAPFTYVAADPHSIRRNACMHIKVASGRGGWKEEEKKNPAASASDKEQEAKEEAAYEVFFSFFFILNSIASIYVAGQAGKLPGRMMGRVSLVQGLHASLRCSLFVEKSFFFFGVVTLQVAHRTLTGAPPGRTRLTTVGCLDLAQDSLRASGGAAARPKPILETGASVSLSPWLALPPACMRWLCCLAAKVIDMTGTAQSHEVPLRASARYNLPQIDSIG